MGKLSQLHAIIVAMLEEGYSCFEIAEELGVPLSMIQQMEVDRWSMDVYGTFKEGNDSVMPDIDNDWDALDDDINCDWCAGDELDAEGRLLAPMPNID